MFSLLKCSHQKLEIPQEQVDVVLSYALGVWQVVGYSVMALSKLSVMKQLEGLDKVTYLSGNLVCLSNIFFEKDPQVL